MIPLVFACVLAACAADGDQQQMAQYGGTLQTDNLPEFSSDTAFSLLKQQVAFGPRVTGMPGHAKQLEWMTDYLRSRADSVEVQRFTHTHSRNNKTLEMANVIARFNPSAQQRVLLLAHWDTRPTADNSNDDDDRDKPIPGANDGASGVAVLMELANIFKRQPPPIGVDLLFVDGEDYGPDGTNMYLGAKHFAANRGTYQPLYGILLDMVGDQNPVFQIEGNSVAYAPEVVDRVWRVAEQLGYSQTFLRSQQGAITDDHVPLNEAGIRTIDIIDFDYPYWHTLQDDVVNTSPKGLGIVGRVLVALIYNGG